MLFLRRKIGHKDLDYSQFKWKNGSQKYSWWQSASEEKWVTETLLASVSFRKVVTDMPLATVSLRKKTVSLRKKTVSLRRKMSHRNTPS